MQGGWGGSCRGGVGHVGVTVGVVIVGVVVGHEKLGVGCGSCRGEGGS